MNLFFWVPSENVVFQGFLLFNALTVALQVPLKCQKLARIIAIAISAATALQLAGFMLGFWHSFLVVLLATSAFRLVPAARELLNFDPTTLEKEFVGKYRPKFFFCNTIHARFVSAKHSFRYPILYVGFPTSFEGSVGGIFSVRGANTDHSTQSTASKSVCKSVFSFFTVNPNTYVNPELPFSKKLEPLLLQNGMNPSDYPYVYFVTTPQFLGYSFNPVSYWYLYNSEMELKLVLLEVNNTFREKHIYFLRSDNPANPPPRKGYTFAGEMEKMFHISPFNHRSGNYTIQVRDPLIDSEAPKVDMHMVVHSRDGKKAMMARAFSVSPSLDLLGCNAWDIFWVSMTSGLNTFLALPVTFFEAWRIFKKKALVYTRPEPLAGSGQRDPTKPEREIQAMWIEYFKARVLNYPAPLKVTLTLPEQNPMRPAEVLSLCSAVLVDEANCQKDSSTVGYQQVADGYQCHDLQSASHQPHLTVKVNTPRFFMRLFSHQDPHHTAYLDISCQPHERQAAIINDLDLFLDVLTKSYASDISVSHADSPLKQPVHGARWRFVSWLRRIKTKLELEKSMTIAETETEPGVDLSFVRDLAPPDLLDNSAINTLDSYFFTTKKCCSNAGPSSSEDLLAKYRRKSLQAILTDILASGESEQLESYCYAAKFLMWLAVVADIVLMGLNAQNTGSIYSGENFWLAWIFRMVYINYAQVMTVLFEVFSLIVS